MNDDPVPPSTIADITSQVRAFYEAHPYPPPVDDLQAYRQAWDDQRRRANSHLFWPAEPFRDDRSILVAGCGTTQAAHYALRWPRARVIGIDVSAKSIAFTQELNPQACTRQPRGAPARGGACRRARSTVRARGLHRRAAPPVRPRCGAASLARGARTDRRPQYDGVCALWPRRDLYAPGLLSPSWHRRDGARDRRSCCQPEGPSAGPSHRTPPAQFTRLRGQGRAGRCAAASAGPIGTRSRSSWISSAARVWRSGVGCARRLTCGGAERWRPRLTNPGWPD